MLSETVDSRTIRMKRKQYDTTGTKTVGTEKRDSQPDSQTHTRPKEQEKHMSKTLRIIPTLGGPKPL
jgi:hypothetical protein